jgi:phosphoribosyl-dephospho-CoA transferase
VEFELVLQHANPLCLLELNKIISLPEAALLLIQQLELHGITSRVYGSYAWQILTGKSYIHQDSDIDILIAVNSIAQLDYALIFFQQLEPLLKIKIDGELIFYHSQAVAWREWLQASEIVLVKSLTSVNLAPRAELLAGLPPC